MNDLVGEIFEIKRTGSFVCGNTKINQLYHNVIWGQKGNYLDIPTDCPQRDERMGWAGDAQVFCRTAAIKQILKGADKCLLLFAWVWKRGIASKIALDTVNHRGLWKLRYFKLI